jgi:hypothetical protein
LILLSFERTKTRFYWRVFFSAERRQRLLALLQVNSTSFPRS